MKKTTYAACCSAVLSILLVNVTFAQVFPPGNGISLTGIDRFDLYVEIASWKDIDTDPQAFRLSAQQQLEQVLGQLGISRRSASQNYLVCSIQATAENDHIAYTASLEYWRLHSTDVNRLMWKNSGIHIVEQDRFTPALPAEACGAYFTEEWQKWNTSGEGL